MPPRPNKQTGASKAGWHSTADIYVCPKMYQFRTGRGIRVPAHKTPDPLGTGLGFHAGRAKWFSREFRTDGATWLAIRKAIKEECEAQKLPVSAQAESRSEELIQQYMNYWSTRPRPRVIAAEYDLGPVDVWQQYGEESAAHPYSSEFFRTGRIDDASYYPEGGNELWIGDAKTTSGTANDVLGDYTLHGQPMLYVALWKFAKQGEAKHGPVAGVMLDVIEKKYPREAGGPMQPANFARIPIRVTDHALQWFLRNHWNHLELAKRCKEWDFDAPRTVGPTSCVRHVGKMKLACEYRELCQYGKDAAGRYVFENGNSLLSWKPEPGKETPPWE